jgi:sec-independent protein translocase protein TatB
MFEVGFTELVLLAVVGLLVLGPERLPGVARTLGGFIRKARMSWISLRNTIEAEMADSDLSRTIKKTGEELQQIGRELTAAPVSKQADKKPEPVLTEPAPAGAAAPGKEPESGKSDNV